MCDEVAQVAKEDLSAVKGELQIIQTKRWQAIGMLKHIFSSVDLPWEFKRHAVDFLLDITNGNNSKTLDDEHNDCSLYMTSLFSALQVVSFHLVFIHPPLHSLVLMAKMNIAGYYNDYHICI